MKKYYLDNAATTPLHPEVAACMAESLINDYANPSSMYDMGIETEKKIEAVRAQIAKQINALPEEITFTSGGTEGDNTIIRGVIENIRPAQRKNIRIITTTIEHPAVKDVFRYFEEKDIEVIWLPVDHEGKIDLDYFKSVMNENTVLVSVIGVHNEIGTIQDLSAIGTVIKTVNPDCVFHSDYVQGFMKEPLNVKKCQLDAVTMCAHKICGPKGVGAIYIRKGVPVKPLLLGGGQEKGFRSGTENISGILGFGKAVEKMAEGGQALHDRLADYKQRMIDAFSEMADVSINGAADGSPYVLNVSFAGLRGEVLLHSLEKQGVYISTGSACSTHKKDKGLIQKAIGLAPEYAEGSIRISFSQLTTEKEVTEATQIIIQAVQQLRKWMKFNNKK